MSIGEEKTISDTAWVIIGIVVFTVLIQVFSGYDALRNGLISALVVAISVLAYRYSVKSNIRTIIGELQPIETNEHKFAPVVNSVKWRPKIISKFLGSGSRFGWMPAQRSATVDIRAYNITGNQIILTDWEKVFEKEDIDEEFLDELKEELNDKFAPTINRVEPNLIGLHISVFSTNGRVIGLIASTALKKLSEKIAVKNA